MTASYKRPAHLALICFVLSVLFFGISFFLGRSSGYIAVSSLSWFFLYVALIWFVLTLQFYQRALAEQEKLDMSLLGKDEKSSTIFQQGNERSVLLSLAQRRLDILEKWFIPIFSGIIAVYQISMGLILLGALRVFSTEGQTQPLLSAILLVALAFISFLLSRYATGMSAQKQWKSLRAGGSSMLAAALLSFAVAVMLALVHLFSNLGILILIISVVISVLMVVLGAETALNLVLDIYRPRIKGQYSRSAFDSRLLGVINEPGGILRSAADAIDYQFGFKVSQTWFYRLLEQAILPLVLFGIVTLYLMSCIVVIEPDEQAIIERFGNPLNDANEVRLIGPGLTFKLPWPVDIARKYSTTTISEIGIGYREDKTAEDYEPNRPKLWGQAHYEEEYLLLVAAEQSSENLTSSTTVPVNLVIAAVPVQYRIKNLYDFIYNHNEPEKLLEAICYRELTKYAASAKLETDDPTDPQSLLGAGRALAGRILTERIQAAADNENLGVEIVFVGLQGIHPPVEVAADYQNVIAAIQEKKKLILDAEAERNQVLSRLVGSVDKAEQLYELAQQYDDAADSGSQDDIDRISEEFDTAFSSASGEIFQKLREAQTYAYQKETLSEATGKKFANQLKAYHAAPEVYIREQWLSMYESALKNVRKYVVVADENDTQVLILDLQDKLSTEGLFRGVQEELENSGQ